MISLFLFILLFFYVGIIYVYIYFDNLTYYFKENKGFIYHFFLYCLFFIFSSIFYLYFDSLLNVLFDLPLVFSIGFLIFFFFSFFYYYISYFEKKIFIYHTLKSRRFKESILYRPAFGCISYNRKVLLNFDDISDYCEFITFLSDQNNLNYNMELTHFFIISGVNIIPFTVRERNRDDYSIFSELRWYFPGFIDFSNDDYIGYYEYDDNTVNGKYKNMINTFINYSFGTSNIMVELLKHYIYVRKLPKMTSEYDLEGLSILDLYYCPMVRSINDIWVIFIYFLKILIMNQNSDKNTFNLLSMLIGLIQEILLEFKDQLTFVRKFILLVCFFLFKFVTFLFSLDFWFIFGYTKNSEIITNLYKKNSFIITFFSFLPITLFLFLYINLDFLFFYYVILIYLFFRVIKYGFSLAGLYFMVREDSSNIEIFITISEEIFNTSLSLFLLFLCSEFLDFFFGLSFTFLMFFLAFFVRKIFGIIFPFIKRELYL